MHKRFHLLFILLPICLVADVSRFLDPISIRPESSQHKYLISNKASALISPQSSRQRIYSGFSPDQSDSKVFLTHELLESKLGELLGYRYQASGKVVAYVTRQWKPIRLSSNFILKIRDCMPDNLSPSTFVRFTIWDNGSSIGSLQNLSECLTS